MNIKHILTTTAKKNTFNITVSATRYIAIFVLLLTTTPLFSQENNYPQNYFRSPMNIPLTTSGTFAEVRNNHFHSGMDYRIGGVVGEPVYAVADGYVSRIKVSAYGGGKTIYITHPNGYKSVYMHLNNFVGEIAEYTKQCHYKQRAFEIDINIPDSILMVKKGMLIANAGNTGGSGGPHLHFELRYAHNDKTINPLLFGLPFNDNIAPTIHNVRLYPAGKNSLINKKNTPMAIKETRTNKKTKKKYTFVNDTVYVCGRFYTGIYATDAAPKSTQKNGVYEIKLFVDDSLYFHYSPKEFMFEETRAINSMIDYEWYKKNRQYYILSRKLKGNKTGTIKVFKNNGYIAFADNKYHKIEYRVTDFSGNMSKISFVVKDMEAPANKTIQTNDGKYSIPIAYYLKNRYKTEGYAVYFDENTFYENDLMHYEKVPAKYRSILTDVHTLTFKNYSLPPHNTYTVKITIPDSLKASKDKLVPVAVNGKTIIAQPFNINIDTVVCRVHTFDGIALSIDTIAPKVSPINFKPGKTISSKMLKVKISDNLSGITKYDCYLNGKWVLAEHDGKTASITIDVTDMILTGKNTLEVVVTDKVKNTTKKEWVIYR